jgi:hypothetical protein
MWEWGEAWAPDRHPATRTVTVHIHEIHSEMAVGGGEQGLGVVQQRLRVAETQATQVEQRRHTPRIHNHQVQPVQQSKAKQGRGT